MFLPLSFYFDKGGEKLVDSLGYFGNFYLIDVLFIVVGFVGMILRKEKHTGLIILWLLLAPIPAALDDISTYCNQIIFDITFIHNDSRLRCIYNLFSSNKKNFLQLPYQNYFGNVFYL